MQKISIFPKFLGHKKHSALCRVLLSYLSIFSISVRVTLL